MTQAKSNRRTEYANALVKLNRNEEAKKQLEEVDEGQLLAGNVETFQLLKTKLELK